MPDISVSLKGLKVNSPLILASGILGTSKPLLERIADEGAGAVTTKTITLEPREGHYSPIITEVESGLLNAVGYKNPGIEKALEEFSNWNHPAPLIFSITGKSPEEFELLAEK
ncbi:MAG: dihydroorotate dehydrogenase, partial [Candidatus ainarchaeum sp.]|nr:dihydroorotate dehydrogenase [Candidatus ainarchaeum sp.]